MLQSDPTSNTLSNQTTSVSTSPALLKQSFHTTCFARTEPPTRVSSQEDQRTLTAPKRQRSPSSTTKSALSTPLVQSFLKNQQQITDRLWMQEQEGHWLLCQRSCQPLEHVDGDWTAPSLAFACSKNFLNYHLKNEINN